MNTSACALQFPGGPAWQAQDRTPSGLANEPSGSGKRSTMAIRRADQRTASRWLAESVAIHSPDMPGRVIDGKAIRDSVLGELAAGVESAIRKGVRPGLAAVLVGEDPASRIYVRNKIRACDRIGAFSETIRLPAGTATEDLLALVNELNGRSDIHGILVQLPLPAHIDSGRVLAAVSPDKDVDGFHPVNVGRLASGQPCLAPCTPRGLIEILKRSEIPIAGRWAVVVGRSNIVGKPAALLLLAEHATVTVCHSRTRDLPSVCRQADILVAAVGRPGLLTREHIREGAVVLDVGMNRIADEATAGRLLAHAPARLRRFRRTGSALVGDVHPGDVREVASAYTPVPGGVGPLTIAMLMSNTLAAATHRLRGDGPSVA